MSEADAGRVFAVVAKLDACGFRGALTGGLAIDAQLRLHGRPARRRPLNDLDFVVSDFESISRSVTDYFLVHHVHPLAEHGKLLLQLVDAEHALRVDVFSQFGDTLTRTSPFRGYAMPIAILSTEDLFARTTSSLLFSLRSGQTYEAKHAQSFRRLDGLGDAAALDLAWSDHRQGVKETFPEAVAAVRRLLRAFPELAISQQYSAVVTRCPKCQDSPPFVRASPERVLGVLGYW